MFAAALTVALAAVVLQLRTDALRAEVITPVPRPAPALARAAAPVAPEPSAATPTAPLPPLHVVGLGDSVMAGTACNCRTILSRFAQSLAQREGRTVTDVNLGVAGYTTQDVLSQLTDDPGTRQDVQKADIVIMIIGANDLKDDFDAWLHGGCNSACYQPDVTAMQDRLVSIIRQTQALRAGQPTTILVDNYWNVFADGDVARAQGGQRQLDWSVAVTTAVNSAIAQASAQSGARTVDLVHVFKGSGDEDPTSLLADDGDHPNAAGVQAIVAANLAALG
ncbi:SGNH/GDSL hydrolase family protein [Propionicimonas paludicola]|nr:SGNH/GDSL hydrolase family protein [Propionicimonas paludicola]